MLLVALVIVTTIAALATYLLVRRLPGLDPASPRLADRAAHALQHELTPRTRTQRVIDSRVDTNLATGLFLTVAAGVIVVGGLVLGVLAVLVRTNSAVVTVDRDISRWVNEHDTTFAHRILDALTHLGAGAYVVVFAIVLAVAETLRLRSRWIVPFLAVLLLGESFVTTSIKELLDRARPTLNPAAHLLGPSFPSGHTATAAAFYTGGALLMGRGRGRRAHAILAAAAVGLAVTVASTRVLLDVHWLSDVGGGLALGWAWFALCSIAFGGRLLRFGAPVEEAERIPSPASAGET